jgi:hypothetical protein
MQSSAISHTVFTNCEHVSKCWDDIQKCEGASDARDCGIPVIRYNMNTLSIISIENCKDIDRPSEFVLPSGKTGVLSFNFICHTPPRCVAHKHRGKCLTGLFLIRFKVALCWSATYTLKHNTVMSAYQYCCSGLENIALKSSFIGLTLLLPLSWLTEYIKRRY